VLFSGLVPRALAMSATPVGLRRKRCELQGREKKPNVHGRREVTEATLRSDLNKTKTHWIKFLGP
jgi:hypothetical protein